MKIVSADGTQIATAAITGEKGRIDVEASALGMNLPATVALEKKGDGLIAHLTIEPLNAHLDIEVEPEDISGLMSGMNRDVMMFAMKAMAKKK